ncbi:MAG TPA: YihY/virulence factor BrkB family protein [Oscillatoriaceae cyanobacterium]
MRIRTAGDFLRQVFDEWREDDVPELGAALAYFTVFSLAPLLTIAVAIAGMVFGRAAARGQVIDTLQRLVGLDGARVIQQMLQNAYHPRVGVVASGFAIVMLFFGAMGVFGQLKDALNLIWEVEPRPGQGVFANVRLTVLNFLMVLGTGLVLLALLILSAVLQALGHGVLGLLPGGAPLWQWIEAIVSFGVLCGLFALIFKYVPDARIDWEDVWLGAAVTGLLFELGKLAIGYYLGNSVLSSIYGASASLVAVLVWVYYSAQILFLGAEFTQVYAARRGRGIRPGLHAMRMPERERREQGIPHRRPPAQPR